MRSSGSVEHLVLAKVNDSSQCERAHTGARAGTNTPFIIETRGLSSTPIIMSDLLDQFPEIKNSGKLVSDIIVFELVLETLLEPRYRRGVIVDGFPRTETQVRGGVRRC
jgi:hypothetical protein